jgi:hypothetical protein
MSKKKHCLFQCALQEESIFGYTSRHDVVEDTELITWDEAVELWEKWKPKVIAQLEDGQSPEMCIWAGCKDNTSYSNDAFHVDFSTEVERGEFVVTTRKVIDPTKVAMGEPVFNEAPEEHILDIGTELEKAIAESQATSYEKGNILYLAEGLADSIRKESL